MITDKCTLDVKPFRIDIPQQDIDDLHTLLKASRITRPVWENQGKSSEVNARDYGIKREWLGRARDAWLAYDWRAQEKRLNELPQYTTELTLSHSGQKESYTIHFLAYISSRPDAVPIIFSHGWPGLYVEFVPMMQALQAKHGSDLPFHAIIPSLPGYAFSSAPPLHRQFTTEDVASLLNQLMLGLGFDRYVAQGGDYGAFVSHNLAEAYEACVAAHFNFMLVNSPPEGTTEYAAMKKMGYPPPGEVMKGMLGFGYALEQATKPSTVGAGIGASPLGLLAWLGEKYCLALQDPPIEEILPFLSIYWFTDCYGSSIFFYKEVFGPTADMSKSRFAQRISKPIGYSKFPREITKPPRHWLEALHNVVYYKEQERGGHWAAHEVPEAFTEDILEFLAVIKDKAKL